MIQARCVPLDTEFDVVFEWIPVSAVHHASTRPIFLTANALHRVTAECDSHIKHYNEACQAILKEKSVDEIAGRRASADAMRAAVRISGIRDRFCVPCNDSGGSTGRKKPRLLPGGGSVKQEEFAAHAPAQMRLLLAEPEVAPHMRRQVKRHPLSRRSTKNEISLLG
jgi:hypothetical protein